MDIVLVIPDTISFGLYFNGKMAESEPTGIG